MTEQTPNPFNVPDAFLANNFTPELGEVYRHLFIGLRREAEARPGLAMLRTMVAERAAHSFTKLKRWDGSGQVYEPDYAKTAKDLTQTVRSLLDSAKDADDDVDVAIRMGGAMLTDAFVDAIDSAWSDGLINDHARGQLLQRTSSAIERSSLA